MYMLKLKKIYLSSVLLIAASLLFVIAAIRIGNGGWTNLSEQSQLILYWGIVLILVQLLIIGNQIRSSVKILGEIRKIASSPDLSKPQATRSLKKLGRLGREIEKLLSHQNEIVELRSNRITALNGLIKILCENSSSSIVITDISGDVMNMSLELKNRLEKEQKVSTGMPENIKGIYSDLPLQKILGFMESQRSIWKDEEYKSLSCIPVFDKMDKLNFCLWEIETERFKKIIKDASQEKKEKKPNRIAGLLKRKKNPEEL